jgi:putative IMPACT (imprinted ancient) family translation regulator
MSLRIHHSTQASLSFKKSEFIGLSFRVFSNTDVEKELSLLRKQHPKARHIAFAYVIDQLEYSNDDHEPSGTAGKPILDVIKKHSLQDVLVCVVRYYGGIPLGASGLTRAYRATAAELLQNCPKVELKKVLQTKISVELKDAHLVFNYLNKEALSYEKAFLDRVYIQYISQIDLFEALQNLLKGKLTLLQKQASLLELPLV